MYFSKKIVDFQNSYSHFFRYYQLKGRLSQEDNWTQHLCTIFFSTNNLNVNSKSNKRWHNLKLICLFQQFVEQMWLIQNSFVLWQTVMMDGCWDFIQYLDPLRPIIHHLDKQASCGEMKSMVQGLLGIYMFMIRVMHEGIVGMYHNSNNFI